MGGTVEETHDDDEFVVIIVLSFPNFHDIHVALTCPAPYVVFMLFTVCLVPRRC